jgi:hypothetical protein
MPKVLIEFSKTQRAFHRCTPEERATANRQARERGHEPDFDIVGVFDTYKAASDFFIASRRSLDANGYFFTQSGEQISPLQTKLVHL